MMHHTRMNRTMATDVTFVKASMMDLEV